MKSDAPVRIIVEDSYVLPSDRKAYNDEEKILVLKKGKEAFFDMKINGLDYRFFVRMLEDLYITQKRGKSARFSKSACEVYNYSLKTLDNFKTIEADSFSHAYKRISEIYRFDKSSHTCNAFTTFYDTEKRISFDKIRDKALQKEISESELNRKWWNELSPTWKQTFLKNIDLDFEPNDFQLVDAITNIIYYGRNDKLRKSIGKLIISKNFRGKVHQWYIDLHKDLQEEVKTFIFQLVEPKHIQAILELEKVDCSGNLAIQDLEALTSLPNLKIIDCQNTGITSLDHLVRCKQLVAINFNITNVKSLASLYAIESLRKISCIQTDVKENEVEDFRASRPNVEVDWRTSEGSLF
jgi:hypothetical protein